MIRRLSGNINRHHRTNQYFNQSVSNILKAVEEETKDHTLIESIYFGPTALTHIRRVIEAGGFIITDTMMVANDIDIDTLNVRGVQVLCFIDDPQVVSLAQQRRITRAEVAVDYGLAIEGPKLMVVGSAPAAVNRMLMRREHEPLSDVCVLAGPAGFANTVQIKEKLMESDLNSIVVRGKKGGVSATITILNAILQEIAMNPS